MTADQDRDTVKGGWREAISPFTQRLRVTAALPGTSASWNSTGAKAFLRILEEMAHKLDVVAPAKIEEIRAERDLAIARVRSLERELSEANDRISRLQHVRKPHEFRISSLFGIGRIKGSGDADEP